MISEDQYVLTKHSHKPIQKFKPGDSIITLYGYDSVTSRRGPVYQTCWTFNFQDVSLVCTEDQLILTLMNGDFVWLECQYLDTTMPVITGSKSDLKSVKDCDSLFDVFKLLPQPFKFERFCSKRKGTMSNTWSLECEHFIVNSLVLKD